jgi:hypothetical protein
MYLSEVKQSKLHIFQPSKVTTRIYCVQNKYVPHTKKSSPSRRPLGGRSTVCEPCHCLGTADHQLSLVPSMPQVTVPCFVAQKTVTIATRILLQFDALLFARKGLLEYELPWLHNKRIAAVACRSANIIYEHGTSNYRSQSQAVCASHTHGESSGSGSDCITPNGPQLTVFIF